MLKRSRVNALANPQVGEYLNQYFVSSYQKVATFRIVGGQKQGGNIASYFCRPGRPGFALHRRASRCRHHAARSQMGGGNDKQALKAAKGDGAAVKIAFRKAHAEKLRPEHGLVVEPVLFDPPDEQDADGPLTSRDPTGRPLAPKLAPPPINGPDVKFADMQKERQGWRKKGSRE